MKKIGVLAGAVTVTALVLGSSTGAQAAAPESAIDEFLGAAQAAAQNGDPIARESLAKDSELSTAEKADFKSALEDGLADGSDSDVVVEESSGTVVSPAATLERSPIYDVTSWCDQKISVVGIVVTQTRISGKYRTSNNAVVGVTGASSQVVTNFQPFTSVSIASPSKSLSGGKGYFSSKVRVERTYGPYFGTQREGIQRMTVNGARVESCTF